MDFDIEVLQNDVAIVVTFMIKIKAFYSLAEDVIYISRLFSRLMVCSVPLTCALVLK